MEARNQAIDAQKKAVEARTRAEDAEQKAVDARNQAVGARNEAQLGFESAWKGLTTLYDSYAAGTLENTPGISARQANALKSRLRGHLLEQLRKLNQEQPDHRGTIQYIARLLLDEGSEAVIDEDYTRAHERLVEALDWSQKHPLDKAPDAETYADILVQQALARYYLSGTKKGNEVAKAHLEKTRELVSRWPESWRLKAAVIRLEHFLVFDDPKNRPVVLALAERLVPLMEKSGGHYDPVMLHFKLRQDACWGEGNFDRTTADYVLEKKLIVWFREHLVQRNVYTLAQLERAVKLFTTVLSFVEKQFAMSNGKTTADERRAILNELETTMKAIEGRLPKSTVVYGARGDLLRLQEKCIADGTNTRSPDDLRAASQRHRMVASALGVGSSVADLLAPAFVSYTADKADQAAKALALATAQSSVRDFMSLDLAGADTVLQNSDIIWAAEKLRQTSQADPLLALHGQMVEQLIRLYQQATPDAKAAFVSTFSATTSAAVKNWFESGQYERVSAFWRACYQRVILSTFTSGQQDSFVKQLNLCIRSLLKTGKPADAKKLLDYTLSLCDTILAERPWDWYVNAAYNSLCFEVAAELAEIGDRASAQPLLRRGWRRQLKLFGQEMDLEKYPELPLRGTVPEKISGDDAKFFARFTKDAGAEFFAPFANNAAPKHSGIERFTIPTDFSGTIYQFHVYVYTGTNGYAELLDQFRWVKEIRAGTVPAEVQDSFKRLNDIAVANKVDFMELCVYALGTAASEAQDRQKRLDAAIDEMKTAEAEYAKDKSDSNRLKLATAYSSAADRALYRERWTDAENWARKSIELNDASNPTGHGNLATAYLFQGKYEQALKIYRAHWQDTLNGKTLGDAALADFEALEKAGIKHPDVARIKSALGTKKDPPPAGAGKKAAETKS